MSTKPASIAPPMIAAPSPAASGASASASAAWTLATPWLIGAALLLSAYVAWFAFRLLHDGGCPQAAEDVRHQVLMAFSLIVAMLVLVVALAAQWLLVARRERAFRARGPSNWREVAEAERARAEAVARDKARFLGMLSHELLTPLQSIWSTMDVIESRGRVEASDPAFTRLKETTRSLRGRISDLVDFAKMSSGRLETRIRGFQLDKLIDTALRDVEEALADAQPRRALGGRPRARPAHLLRPRAPAPGARQPAHQRHQVHRARRHLHRRRSCGRDEGVMRVEISDTGVGIDPDAMARLFEPFYRSPQTAGMAEGSGLGLAVVRSLVDLMGGRIRFDSRVGQGTAVTRGGADHRGRRWPRPTRPRASTPAGRCWSSTTRATRAAPSPT